ncbi:acyl transferase/acyl hydrolase/lysophospholipase [Lipomyces tetrasporus]|uniref:Lysophospholipase n=1 Tax=Lipomyces tetrasporus TaxID=54092 RepID=A0AAD7QLY7_9ASCO|nr:acyl transferase/acyl hydrolase/lysophospholipase [Lipomyces tetrasporus]KAJ8097633.1 acyl transferase/acyl hydrolase/lysophospholipase [Lipomyces tetrasporus]
MLRFRSGWPRWARIGQVHATANNHLKKHMNWESFTFTVCSGWIRSSRGVAEDCTFSRREYARAVAYVFFAAGAFGATVITLQKSERPILSEEPPKKEPEPGTWSSLIEYYNQLQAAMAQIGDTSWDSVVEAMKDSVSYSISLPAWMRKIQHVMDMESEDSLGYEIVEDSTDITLNPEIAWSPAFVRLGPQLSNEEAKFRNNRTKFTKKGIARYLDIPESSIDERDIPTIAITGSGGGYRAMIATCGYISALQNTGLFDCTTYLAGVSGSTWLMALFYTVAEYNTTTLIDHIKARTGIHIAFLPAAMELLTTAPTDKYLLHGIIEKMHYGYTGVAIADIYGVLLSSRLLVPKNEVIVDRDILKISSQRRIVDTGAVPMPIYTAVRHEIGLTSAEQEAVDKSATQPEKTAIQETEKRESWFQWFEFTPYEVGCEEAGAWIPTWSLGRKWRNGTSVEAVPELNLTLLLGTFGSAFCATLSHFYKEVRPALPDIAISQSLDNIMKEKDANLRDVHPITPAGIPNYLLGLKSYLPRTCPESMHTAKDINLMDAGLDNNLAMYPLLRPEREVDMILAFDCSADVSDVPWLELTAGYTKKHGILGWPVEAGWPKGEDFEKDLKMMEESQEVESTGEALGKIQKEKEKDWRKKTLRSKGKQSTGSAEAAAKTLGPVTIWTGTIEDKSKSADSVNMNEAENADTIDEEYKLRSPNAGITVVYCPLIPNKKLPGVDPDTSPYMSTWNFVYTPDDVDNIIGLAQTNFSEGEARIRRAVRLIYERKKQLRLERERAQKELWKDSILHSRRNG